MSRGSTPTMGQPALALLSEQHEGCPHPAFGTTLFGHAPPQSADI